MKGGIDVLDHVVNIGVMLVDEFVDLAEALLERPVSQLLYFSCLDFINGQKLFVMLLMTTEKAGLADQTCWKFTLRSNADVEYVFAVMTINEAFGCHGPLDPMDIL